MSVHTQRNTNRKPTMFIQANSRQQSAIHRPAVGFPSPTQVNHLPTVHLYQPTGDLKVITVKTQSIKAACSMAATKNSRSFLAYVLVGVQILVRDDGDVHVRATDGTLAFDDLMPEKSAFAPAYFIIPLDIAKLIAKSKASTVEITIAPDGRYECAGQIFKPLDGKFPNCDQIMPTRNSKFDADVNQYDAELLARCQTAMRIATGLRKAFFKMQNSPCGLMHRENNTDPRCAVAPLTAHAFLDN